MSIIDTLVGNQEAKRHLERFVLAPEPSTFLFHGLSGIGKKKAATLLAKSLNCLDQAKAFCSCSSCTKIDKGLHADIQYVAPSTKQFKVDEVRAVLNECGSAPLEGRWKVFIMEDCQTLNMAASDALLKTLEDGIRSTVFILLSTSEQAIQHTLRARSKPIRFTPLSVSELRDVVSDMGIYDMNSPKMETAIHLAAGSVEGVAKALSSGIELRDKALSILMSLARVPEHEIFSTISSIEKDLMWDFLDHFHALGADALLVNLHEGILKNKDCYSALKGISDSYGDSLILGMQELRDSHILRSVPTPSDHQVANLILRVKRSLRETAQR